MIPRPPALSDLRAGTKLVAGIGKSTVLADIDFETYSPAGFTWNPERKKFEPPHGARVKGLPAIGAAVYAEHPDAEVLSCAYNLKDGEGAKLWTPADPPPLDLFSHVENGGILEAWNSMFEYLIWTHVCVKRYGWPRLWISQLRCAMAKSRAYGLPGSLAAAGDVIGADVKKDKDGKRLLTKFSIPRNPTLKDARLRITPTDDTQDAELLYKYNLQDIAAESEISSKVPDLIPSELEFWQHDQEINARGVGIDREAVANCLAIVEEAHAYYNSELAFLTNGRVKAASEIARLVAWMHTRGIHTDTLDDDKVEDLLNNYLLPPDVFEALKIRKMIGSAAVKKLYAMTYTATSKGRIHDLFIYHSARTGRAAGAGVQPQNLPNSGDALHRCTCRRHYTINITDGCPWCGNTLGIERVDWNTQGVEDALEVIATRNLNCVQYFFGNAISTISGCLRGMFIPAPGYDFICSDYSAIEAVVLAALAGESWRLEVFRTHGKIYEMSASKVCGIPFDEFELYKATSGSHHPKRKLGKVAELASGYQGWLGAWKQFGADEFFDDEQIKQAILAWRDASPAIVHMWGGQPDWRNEQYYGLEGAAVQAVLNPGTTFSYQGINYFVNRDVLYCQLLSGRNIVYHRPQLYPSEKRPGTHSLTFEGWNSNPKYGAIGWIRMSTYGGKLTENVVQATARDILAHAIVNLEKAGYAVVLHVHDEIVVEVPEDYGSIQEVERIMSTMPTWAQSWPVSARGGWRAKRYAK